MIEGQLVSHGSSRKVRAVAGQIAEHLAAAIEAIPILSTSVAIAAERVAEDAPALLAAPVALARAMTGAFKTGTSKGAPSDDHGASSKSVGYGGLSLIRYLKSTWQAVDVGVAVMAAFVGVEAGLAGEDGCGERSAIFPDLGEVLTALALGHGLAVDVGVADQAHFDWLAGQTEVDHDFRVATGDWHTFAHIWIGADDNVRTIGGLRNFWSFTRTSVLLGSERATWNWKETCSVSADRRIGLVQLLVVDVQPVVTVVVNIDPHGYFVSVAKVRLAELLQHIKRK